MSFLGSNTPKENVISCLNAIFDFRYFALQRHLVIFYRLKDLGNEFLGVNYPQETSKKLKLVNFVKLDFWRSKESMVLILYKNFATIN